MNFGGYHTSYPSASISSSKECVRLLNPLPAILSEDLSGSRLFSNLAIQTQRSNPKRKPEYTEMAGEMSAKILVGVNTGKEKRSF
jgi:hypothetical protein